MAEKKLKVADDMVVSMDYVLRLDDGEVIETSESEAPLQFLQGRGQIIPGLEQVLYGMTVGEEMEVEVAPAEGYGERDPEAYQVVSRDVFPPDLALELGMGLHMRDETGQVFEVFVADIRPEGVLLDFNHPLAGETLYFQVKVAGLRPATSEELAHGHTHGAEHSH